MSAPPAIHGPRRARSPAGASSARVRACGPVVIAGRPRARHARPRGGRDRHRRLPGLARRGRRDAARAAATPATRSSSRSCGSRACVCALLVGVALGISGAIFQTLTRNPLGSPDIVGFQARRGDRRARRHHRARRAAALQASLGALVGGLLTAAVVYVLARQARRLSGYRLVLVGIAISALMLALNDYLLSRARIEDAQEATRWLLGSLNGRTGTTSAPLADRAARSCCRGDACSARALRTARARRRRRARARPARRAHPASRSSRSPSRSWRSTTTAIGPVAFVALTAPQIARRLARTAEPRCSASALTGALIVLASDIVAQRLVPDTPLPVGVVTGAVGGVYLVWLLGDRWRSEDAHDRTRTAATRDGVTLAYDKRVVAEGLDVRDPRRAGSPRSSGRTPAASRRCCARSRACSSRARARVLLDGTGDPRRCPPSRSRAGSACCRRASIAPDGITVVDLVARGRHPHQSLLRQWSRDDERAVAGGDGGHARRRPRRPRRSTSCPAASASASGSPWRSRRRPSCCCSTSRRRSSTSSTRSRCSTCAPSCTSEGRTLVAVLHDLNQACRYADHLIALREGRVVARGAPAEIVDAELVEQVFGVRCRVMPDPETGTPMVVPAARRAIAARV